MILNISGYHDQYGRILVKNIGKAKLTHPNNLLIPPIGNNAQVGRIEPYDNIVTGNRPIFHTYSHYRSQP